MAQNKEVMTFRKVIPFQTKDVLAQRVKGSGTIEGFRVRFYPGQVHALQVIVFVEHKGQKIEYLTSSVSTGKPYLSGDDDYFEFPVIVPVENDDYIKVSVFNDGADVDHNLVVDVFVDYYGGNKRVVGGVY